MDRKEYMREYLRKWREANKKKMKEYQRAYFQENKDRLLAARRPRRRKWRAANRGEYLRKRREYEKKKRKTWCRNNQVVTINGKKTFVRGEEARVLAKLKRQLLDAIKEAENGDTEDGL